MRTGYMRLQALVRSRVLSHKFRHLRGHMVRLQARSRGYLVRRHYRRRLWAVVTLQAHVRRMIAVRRYRKLRLEHRALAAKEREARDLEKKYGKRKAMEIAESNFAVTLAALQKREREEEAERVRILDDKKRQ